MNDVMISERSGLVAMLLQTAEARESAPEVADDLRYTTASESIRQIAATLDLVPDATLLRLAHINELSAGMLARLITTRLLAIGFELPPVDDAVAFFAPIEAEVARIFDRARRKSH